MQSARRNATYSVFSLVSTERCVGIVVEFLDTIENLIRNLFSIK
jgi:hypothetical protein